MADVSTGLIHHPYVPPAGFDAPQPGVFKASTVFFPTVADMRSREWKDKTAYTYGLHGTPTTYVLEERISTLEGGLQTLLVPSGLAAIANVALSLLKTGDEVLIPDNAYGPSKTLAEGELKAWGIRTVYYDPMSVADLQAKITPATRLVWVEAAGSVTLEFPDLVAMVRVCKQACVPVALDNTWGAGLAFQPFDLVPGESLGVDVSAHALTKYPSGGGDVLMGAVTTRDIGLHMRLKLTHMRLGLGVGANDAELVLRALPSIALRYRAHDDATPLPGVLGTTASGLRPGVASGIGNFTRPRPMESLVREWQRRCRGFVQRGRRCALHTSPMRHFLQQLETVQNRLQLGWPHQFGGAVRAGVHAPGMAGALGTGYLDSLLRRPGECGRFARRPGPGPGCVRPGVTRSAPRRASPAGRWRWRATKPPAGTAGSCAASTPGTPGRSVR